MPQPKRTDTGRAASERVDWVDYAKGFCIVFVVMMHSTLSVEATAGQEGWMHYVVAFAKPFRMPDFFMISGLFLARVIDRDWITYVDRKVVHFAYFYVLWVTIQFAFKTLSLSLHHGALSLAGLYALAFVQPFGTLWFIYLLPIFFVVTKLTKNIPPLAIWIVAAGLEMLPYETGWIVGDEFAWRFVYFYTGYILAGRIFALAAAARQWSGLAAAVLAVWGLANYEAVARGWSELPLISLSLGLFGAAAVVMISALMAKFDMFAPLRLAGENSIVIYLAFFLPMAVSQAVLLKTGYVTDGGAISMLVTAAGVITPMVAYYALSRTKLSFLFKRPAMFRLDPIQPASPPVEPYLKIEPKSQGHSVTVAGFHSRPNATSC